MLPRSPFALLIHGLVTLVAAAVIGCSAFGGEPADRAADSAASGTSPSGSADVGLEPDVPPLLDAVDTFGETVVVIAGSDGDVRVDAKVADTARERRQGLMNVPVVPDGVGMLFLYPGERSGGFWMKDTPVALDIAFADAEGTLVKTLSMQPCSTDPCPVHDPGVAYTAALEVPRGWFSANGVATGDQMTLGPVTAP